MINYHQLLESQKNKLNKIKDYMQMIIIQKIELVNNNKQLNICPLNYQY